MASTGLLRTASLAAALLATLPASALADGGRGRGHYKHGYDRHHDGGYYAPYRGAYYYNDYHRRRGRISGGEAALIAAGVIGGVILIDQALDARDRESRYDPYYSRERGAFGDDEPYYSRDDRYDGRYDERYGASGAYDPYEEEYGLAGGPERDRYDGAGEGGYERGAVEAAFRECLAETRGAAGAGGLIAAFPSEPDRVDPRGRGWRIEASFRASNARGQNWSRRMICEADEGGVRFLQID